MKKCNHVTFLFNTRYTFHIFFTMFASAFIMLELIEIFHLLGTARQTRPLGIWNWFLWTPYFWHVILFGNLTVLLTYFTEIWLNHNALCSDSSSMFSAVLQTSGSFSHLQSPIEFHVSCWRNLYYKHIN